MPEFDNPILDFMYWYSKLFIFGINRKKFELEVAEDKLWALNNSRNTIWAILFFGLGSCFFFTGIFEIQQSHPEIDAGFIVVFFVVHPVFACISLRQFLWLINGKQELTIENGNLTLRKRGTFFTKDKVYPLAEISNIRKAIDEEQLTPVELVVAQLSIFRKAFLKQVFGEILFRFQFNDVKVFNELSDEQKDLLIAELIKRQV